jgi:D-alanyl-lipoteichoic acid acyltransferase DltB (MBOAT superfamily)
MLFDSALFLWFFAAVFVVYWGVSRFPSVRIAWLLVASYAFYAAWNVELLALIVGSTLLDFYVGRALHRSEDAAVRTRWLLVSLCANLGLLSLFKYGNFVLSSVQGVLDAAAVGATLPVLDLVLPVGISFYTFQTLSYTIDIYRRRLEPTNNLLHFALFVSFFPQLVAGPIVRASEFLHQIPQRAVPDAAREGAGLFLIARGLTKKIVFADYLATSLVDRVFDNPELYSSVEILFAVYGYAVQIYCDFSGYSDVAIGAAMLLGFKLPENFRRPYGAADLQDFWRRWHITLSTWLRDYLYIPLGGNRGGTWGTYRNLAITMLLGGLWHGAAWTFVVWGALHGAALGVVRMVQRRWPPAREGQGGLRRMVGVVVTFHFVCFCWIFFRARSFENAGDVLAGLARGTAYTPNLTLPIVAAIGGAMLLHWTPRRWIDRGSPLFAGLPSFVQGVLLAALAIALAQLKGAGPQPFIYFQF